MDEESTLLDSELEGVILHSGKYKVLQRLAKGGMAWVYKAEDTTNGAFVALKILFQHLTNEPKMRQRFLREAQIQRDTLEHPNIVRVLDIIEEEGLLGFTMEWCDSGDLRNWQAAFNAPLSAQHLKAFIPPLLDAIAGAHRKNIVHRDLKPQNILLASVGDVLIPKIADFGIAKLLDGHSSTKTGSLIGTIAYMAPEQMEDSKHIDHKADIYSMGVILYLMATARLPFEGDGPAALIKILYEEPPVPEEAPASLHPVLMKCLEKDPDDRYSTCEELKAAFEKALGITPNTKAIGSASLAKAPEAGGNLSINPIHASSFQMQMTPSAPKPPVIDESSQATVLVEPNDDEDTIPSDPDAPSQEPGASGAAGGLTPKHWMIIAALAAVAIVGLGVLLALVK